MAEGDDEGADAQRVGIGELGRRRPRARHAEECQVRATIGDDEARVDVPIIGEPDASPRGARDVSVRHDEVGRPQDAGAAARLGVDLHRHLPEPLGDPGKVRWRGLRRAEDAHRR